MAPETPRPALTPRQQKILDAIRTEIEQKGYPPSMRQIGDMVGLASLSSVTHQLGRLEKMGYIPKKMIFGDGYKGYVEQAPYDRILVTAGAPEVPMELLAQLKIGGRLVIPIGKGEQIMTVFTRLSPNEFNKEEYGTFGFVPMLENVQAKIR